MRRIVNLGLATKAELMTSNHEEQTEAQMARIKDLTGVEVPKYYNPNAINPLKFAEQQRSEEHTSELQSHLQISYAVFCLKKFYISC